MLKPNGYFVITSCNWTQDELVASFTEDKALQEFRRLPWPVVKFGGKEGARLATVAFVLAPSDIA
eukprot:NODE_4549_length_571_cov_209.354406_g3305_i0.p4 GENE.NODE_4549_length_571_cov_209.354406_g3305_i0~~NODE_4549_length_571_cov_209.354406_g3305_i0.p4  ORF type:complete len:65 (-),score=19.43 NODE_4549_length_571_cov_209.354406_g3305_i0:25-219(-)